MQKVSVKFRRNAGLYFAGEVAGFDPVTAKGYIDRGIAVPFLEDAAEKPAPEEPASEAVEEQAEESADAAEKPVTRRRRR